MLFELFLKKEGIQQEEWAPFAEGKNGVFTNPVLTAIAERHGKSVGQVMLRWLLQRGISVIPKSVRKERMQENMDVFDFELSADDMAQIATLDTGRSTIINPDDIETARWMSSMVMEELK